MAEQDNGLTPEALPEAQSTPDSGDAASPEEKPARTYTQAEVDEAIAKVKANQRSKAYRREQKLRRELEGAISQASVMDGAVDEPGEPKRREDESYEDFIARKAIHTAKQAARETLQEDLERRQQDARARAQADIDANWNKAKEEGRKKYADFDDVTGNEEIMISPAMAGAIKESEVGHDIAYYLGQHPDEAEDIAGQSIMGQIRAIGRLEAKLAGAQAPTRKPAEPIRPLENRGRDNSLELSRNLSQDEWNRRWQLRRASKARAQSGG